MPSLLHSQESSLVKAGIQWLDLATFTRMACIYRKHLP